MSGDDGPPVVAPVPGHDDAWFWEGARRGELLIRRCGACGRLQHPPLPLCPGCGADAWTTVTASGRGRVYSWIVSRPPRAPTAPGRIVVLVELEEGTRLVSNLVGVDAAKVINGMAVEVCFVAVVDDVVLPQFRPAE